MRSCSSWSAGVDQRLVHPQRQHQEHDQRAGIDGATGQPVATDHEQQRDAQLDHGHGARGERQDEHGQPGVDRPQVVERPPEPVEPLAAEVERPDHRDALDVLDDAPGRLGLGVLPAQREPVEDPVGDQVDGHGDDHAGRGERR